MKLDNRIRIEATVQFGDLAIGDVYEDSDGVTCIKTSDRNPDDCYGSCLAYVDEEWREDEEHKGRYIKPLEATITLHGYKMKARN